jgi:serine/threonine-protein kinase RsbW
MPTLGTIAMTAPAEAASVPLLRGHVVGFVADQRVCSDRAEDIRLAVSEALSNAVLHAYRGPDATGEVEVRATRTDTYVEVVVRDSGDGMAPRSDSPGLGLGLPMIARITDRLQIERPTDAPGTAVRMHFDC